MRQLPVRQSLYTETVRHFGTRQGGGTNQINNISLSTVSTVSSESRPPHIPSTPGSGTVLASVSPTRGTVRKSGDERLRSSRARLSAKYDASNLQCARIIAADPIRYPGGAQLWAAAVLARLQETESGDSGGEFELKS